MIETFTEGIKQVFLKENELECRVMSTMLSLFGHLPVQASNGKTIDKYFRPSPSQ